MSYEVILGRRVEKFLVKLDRPISRRIINAVEALGGNPYPPGVQQMKGYENRWRIRVGDYRIIYEIYEQELVVLVVRVGHRKEVYRRK